jgi:hypothetical protein
MNGGLKIFSRASRPRARTHTPRAIIELDGSARGAVEAGYIMGTFSPGWWSLPGLKGHSVTPVGAPNRNKRAAGPLFPVGGSNRH